MTSNDPGEVLAELLVHGSPAAVRGHIDAALDDGVDARHVCVDLITPALYEVGRLWQTARITIAQEHLASSIAQIEVARLAPKMRREPPVGRTAMLAATPGELHTVGLSMLREVLEADGWLALYLGQSTPAADLVTLARERRPDVVGLSTALTTHLVDARATFHALAALPERPWIVAGGYAYGGDEALALSLGADEFMPDAGVAADRLRRRFGHG